MNVVHQGLLEQAIHSLFPGKNILSNARKEASIKNPVTGSFLEIDVWIPDILLGFEFQDTYHYEPTWDSHLPLDNVKHKDNSKLAGGRTRGITLIVVPCWWDGDANSLKGSVAFQRPDLFPEINEPVTLNAPLDYFKSTTIPVVESLMLASFPSSFHIHETDEAEYYTWWMGEKYDGVRCCWQVLDNELYSRNGLQLSLPLHMYRLFPPTTFLDGEIWFGRGGFSEAQKTVYALLPTIDWQHFRIVTFDTPSPHVRLHPFEYRYSSLVSVLPTEHPFIALAHRLQGQSQGHVVGYIHCIIQNEGEGVILQRPADHYLPGSRASSLLKLKASRSDKEGLVVRVDLDKSLLLQLPTGETFIVPKKNVQCESQPIRGDVVSFTFENYRNAVPFNPKVVRIRKDVSWKQVLHDASVRVPKSQSMTDHTLKVVDGKFKPVSYGKAEKQKSARSFFESVAFANNLDPLLPESWYSITQTQIKSTKEGRSVLLQYNGSFIKALIGTFPDIRFEVRKFAYVPMNFWREVGNRRQFFINMARKLGFDPLVAENWYKIDDSTFSTHKGAASVEFYYRGGFAKALLHLFPEIGLDETKFTALPYNHWANVHHRRSFLEDFAQKMGFDPHNPEHWYIILKERILSTKNLSALLAFYRGSIANALTHLFPNIGLNASKLLSVSRYYWKEVINRRNFFVYLAREKGFDPLIARNWYGIRPETIVQSMGASSVLAYYNDDYVLALVHLFPEIGLNPALLAGSTRNHIIEADHRRKFEKLARQHGFDPLVAANWYSFPKDRVASMKGGTSLLFAYGHSVSRALTRLFPEVKWDIAKFRRKRNHWDDESNRRAFFEDFAATKGGPTTTTKGKVCPPFDPLNAEHWYNVPATAILASKGSDAVLRYYSGSVVTALRHLFPTIGIDPARFVSPPPKKRWTDTATRRAFFHSVAQSKSLDPLHPSTWYELTYEALLKFKGARSVLWHYGGSLVKALIDLFPDVEFNVAKFVHTKYGFWKSAANRRLFFIHFAASFNFDPLVANNWYSMVDNINNHKGISSVLHHHGGSITNALIQLFPDVQFDESQFGTLQVDAYWFPTQNRRKFFKDFAITSSFDPLVATNWYSVSKSAVLEAKGAASVLAFYKGSLPKALMSVFREIGLNEKKFTSTARG